MTADGMSPAEPRCTCGSGAHPRRCSVHPCAYDLHRLEINFDLIAEDNDCMEKAIEAALVALKRVDTLEAIRLLEAALTDAIPETQP